ncbi:NAD(P)-binding domain-containing protein [Qipengyuania sp. XHP0207]|uniref:NAD(P)H-dependent glycerol-3-phosphate dehydrogenase n=1 Tax=Qipengyuania sp. XHP0207 TaxID=3038078 RepID=UPI00241C8758|nr:NAD(P)H-dependent glycerol-3-phosphate dehydrogenase [Qipengyuania sp. XHP0207]MDG5747274.1 NAD(P)-binding domain-containing protein [Qipengyuania sp. XHP0207]
MSCERVTVLGGGSFGTGVAAALARSGTEVKLYCRSSEQAEEIECTRVNSRYFPGHSLDPLISASHDLEDALNTRVVFLAIPAREVDNYIPYLQARASSESIIVNLAKGLHPRHFTFYQLFKTTVPQAQYVALKGPTFARPILLGELSGFTCGTNSLTAREHISRLFRDSNICLDYSDTPDAVDALGAIKNTYALVLGIAAALGLSENTVYLLVTRILKEVSDLLSLLGHDPSALFSYGGVGDLLLTGLCDTSRNRTFGFILGRGIEVDLDRNRGFLSEGARAINILLSRCEPEAAPLLFKVRDILAGNALPNSILSD